MAWFWREIDSKEIIGKRFERRSVAAVPDAADDDDDDYDGGRTMITHRYPWVRKWLMGAAEAEKPSEQRTIKCVCNALEDSNSKGGVV